MDEDDVIKRLLKKRNGRNHVIQKSLYRHFIPGHTRELEDARGGILLRATRRGYTEPETSSDLQDIIESYNVTHKLGQQVGEWANDYVRLGECYAASKYGKKGKFVGKALGYIAQSYIDDAENVAKRVFNNYLIFNNEQLLKKRLLGYFERNGGVRKYYDKAGRNGVHETAKDVFIASGLASEFDSLEGEGSQIAKNIAINLIEKKLENKAFERNDDDEELNEDSIEELVKNNADALNEYSKLLDETQTLVENINNNVEGISTNLKEIMNTTTEIGEEASAERDTLHEFKELIFGGKNPQDKISDIKREYPTLTGKERKTADQKIKVLQDQKKLNDNIKKYMRGAQNFSNIINNLGFDESITRPVNDAVQIGSTILSAYLELSGGGGVLGAVSLASNLFGSGDKTNQQMLESLALIRQKLERMDAKLERLLDGQQSIMTALEEIFEAIIVVDRKIALAEKRIVGELIDIKALIVQEYEDELRVNEGLRVNGDSVIDVENYSIPDFSELAKTCVDIKNLNLSPGPFDLFERIFVDSPHHAIHPCLTIKYQSSNHNGDPSILVPANKLDNHYSELLSFYKDLADYYSPNRNQGPNQTDGLEAEPYFLLALNPSSNTSGVERKALHLDKVTNPYNTSIILLASKFIHIPYFERCLIALLNTHFLVPIYSATEGQEALSAEDFISYSSHNSHGLEWLKQAQTLIDWSVLQQSLLTGDAFLPLIYRLLLKEELQILPNEIEENRLSINSLYSRLVKLMSDSPSLSSNILLYSIRKRIQDSDTASETAYQTAINSGNVWRLNEIISFPQCNIQHREGKLKIWINYDLWADIPVAKDVSMKALKSAPSLFRLFELRGMVIDAIQSYDLVDKSSKFTSLSIRGFDYDDNIFSRFGTIEEKQ